MKINQDKINFSNYSQNDLMDAFAGVDDIKYPDNAIEIYQRLLKKLNLGYKEVTAELLGYEENVYINVVIIALLGSYLSLLLFGDSSILNNEMAEKIKRLNLMIKSNH